MMLSGGWANGRDRGLKLAMGVLLGVVLAVMFAGPLEALPLPVCVFKQVTGVSCFTCGLTRSLQAGVHGQIGAALHFHLLGPFLVIGLAVAAVVCVAEGFGVKTRKLFGSRRLQKTVSLVFLSAWILYGVVRAIVELWL